MDELIQKLLQGSNPFIAILVMVVLYLLRDKIAGLFKKPVDPVKPDEDSNPVLDMIWNLLSDIFKKKTEAVAAPVKPVDSSPQNDIAIAALISLLKSDPDTAQKLKEKLP